MTDISTKDIVDPYNTGTIDKLEQGIAAITDELEKNSEYIYRFNKENIAEDHIRTILKKFQLMLNIISRDTLNDSDDEYQEDMTLLNNFIHFLKLLTENGLTAPNLEVINVIHKSENSNNIKSLLDADTSNVSDVTLALCKDLAVDREGSPIETLQVAFDAGRLSLKAEVLKNYLLATAILGTASAFIKTSVGKYVASTSVGKYVAGFISYLAKYNTLEWNKFLSNAMSGLNTINPLNYLPRNQYTQAIGTITASVLALTYSAVAATLNVFKFYVVGMVVGKIIGKSFSAATSFINGERTAEMPKIIAHKGVYKMFASLALFAPRALWLAVYTLPKALTTKLVNELINLKEEEDHIQAKEISFKEFNLAYITLAAVSIAYFYKTSNLAILGSVLAGTASFINYSINKTISNAFFFAPKGFINNVVLTPDNSFVSALLLAVGLVNGLNAKNEISGKKTFIEEGRFQSLANKYLDSESASCYTPAMFAARTADALTNAVSNPRKTARNMAKAVYSNMPTACKKKRN